MHRAIVCILFLLVSLTVHAAPSAPATPAANTPSLLGHFGKWQAYTSKEEGKKICYMTAVPQKSEHKCAMRGEVFMIITHRPHLNSFDSISIDLGYPIDVQNKVKLEIDGKFFDVDLIQNETAWAMTAEQDKAIAHAIAKARRHIIVHSKSTKGTVTKDVYPLNGAMAALKAISKECGCKR